MPERAVLNRRTGGSKPDIEDVSKSFRRSRKWLTRNAGNSGVGYADHGARSGACHRLLCSLLLFCCTPTRQYRLQRDAALLCETWVPKQVPVRMISAVTILPNLVNQGYKWHNNATEKCRKWAAFWFAYHACPFWTFWLFCCSNPLFPV